MYYLDAWTALIMQRALQSVTFIKVKLDKQNNSIWKKQLFGFGVESNYMIELISADNKITGISW